QRDDRVVDPLGVEAEVDHEAVPWGRGSRGAIGDGRGKHPQVTRHERDAAPERYHRVRKAVRRECTNARQARRDVLYAAPRVGETGGTGSAAPQGRRVCIETSVCAVALVTSGVVNVHGLSLESGPSDVPLWWIFNEEHGQGER